MNDSVEKMVTEPSRVKKSKNRKKIIGGVLAIAILGGGVYVANRIYTKNEIYKLSSIKNNTTGDTSMFKADSIKNNVDGRIKYEYNVLAYRYEIYKHQYEIVKANIDKFSDDSTNPADAKIFWDAYSKEHEVFCDKLLDKQTEHFEKFRDCQADNLPFSPQDITTELKDEVAKIMSELNNPLDCGHVYKEYVKTELLTRYKKVLGVTYDKMDKLHMKISNM